jgi:hypothetical protein
MIRPEELNLTVPILGPEAAKGVEQAGLLKYLKDHPTGYVQLEEPIFISTDGQTSRFWQTVACVAPARAAADFLCAQVRLQLAGTSVEPGFYAVAQDAVARQTADGVYAARPAFEILTIDGQPVRPINL